MPHWVPITDIYYSGIRRKINNYFLTNSLISQLDADSSTNMIQKGAAYKTIDVDDAFFYNKLIINAEADSKTGQSYVESSKILC